VRASDRHLNTAEWRHARAITLSLQGSAQPPSITPALCIDDDDDHDDEEARFQADLARAIAASKENASPATSIASLSSDQNQTDGVGNASTSASAVVTTAHSSTSSSFLAERAQLEQQRLARLKRSRGETDSHVTGPPSKRQSSSSRELSGTPASESGQSRREKERVDEEAEVFWDGELRQTANMHVSPGHNGTNGKAVFRLSEIIGDVRLFPSYSYSGLLMKSKAEKGDRTGDHLDLLPRAFLDLHLFRARHSRRARDPTGADREWERNDKTSSSELDSRHTLLAWWTWCDAYQGALALITLVLSCLLDRPSSSCSFIAPADYASSFPPPISSITTGAISKIQSGSRMYLSAHPLYRTNPKLTISLRLWSMYYARST
jgi:hypothetical protein